MSESDDSSASRSRTLTERGQQQFEDEYSNRNKHICKAYDKIANHLNRIPQCSTIEDLESVQKELSACGEKHSQLCLDLVDFCQRRGTLASKELAQTHRMTHQGCKILIDSATRQIKNRINDIAFEERSTVSSSTSRSSLRSSTSSRRSQMSSVILRTRAKAKVATTRLKFVELETEMKKKQASLDEQKARADREMANLAAELDLLEAKREAAAAEAEVDALSESPESSETSVKYELNIQSEPLDAKARTKTYVQQLNSAKQDVQTRVTNNNQHIESSYRVNETNLDPRVEPFFPSQSVAGDFTRYLLKKDLLLSRLSQFDDRPETYLTWKTSFRAVMEELKVTPMEELDLLVKWTGQESKRHVISIKSANASNPSIGLIRAWQRLEERYGYPEMLEASLKRRVEQFPKLTVKDNKKLFELYDLASEIDSIKSTEKMKPLLGHYDSSIGVTPMVNKLPHNLQEKWTTTAVRYMNYNEVAYPPFGHFVEFLRDQSRIKNNPSFFYETTPFKKENNFQKRSERNTQIHVKKTETTDPHKPSPIPDNNSAKQKCPLHLTEHSLNKCRVFRAKHIGDRIKFIKEKRICFKCCESTSHIKRDCKNVVRCKECNSDEHPSALHVDHTHVNSSTQQTQDRVKPSESRTDNGGEYSDTTKALCTRICGGFSGKSCSKIILVNVFLKDKPENVVRLYVMIDDQSNRTLASSQLFDMLAVEGDETEYTLVSCSGKVRTAGRRTNGLVVESIDRAVQLDMPTVIECDNLPDNRNEIPTPEVAESFYHLQDIAHHIPQIANEAHIMMLIGRDVISAHHVLDQRIGLANLPYAQKLRLGWCIIGESCLGSVHVPKELRVNKTSILENGRPTLFDPCNNQMKLKEIVHDVFEKKDDDDKPGLSIEDRSFLNMMDSSFRKDENGNWSCPLPFRHNRPKLLNNYEQVLRRAIVLDKSLRKDQMKREHFLEFMEAMFSNGHAEKAPPLPNDTERWYLPIFGVYHHRKKDKVRVVFDSAAKCNGVSLNDVLLPGPDLTNSLLGILLRFRLEPVAVVADIQQMLYSFKVDEHHRDYLRFLWHEQNDINKPLTEYRMCVHIFGNTASPSIASYGLKQSAMRSNLGSDVTHFVLNDFYVDDGLTSLPTATEAVTLLKKTQEALITEGKLRLHKIASNNKEVMEAFPPEDLAKNLENLKLTDQSLPVQHSLGIRWSLDSDTFSFDISTEDRPYSRRGVLSTINSIFDPLGFLAPVVVEGRLIQRQLINSTSDWDQPLPTEFFDTWNCWTSSLQELDQLHIRRTYLSDSFSKSEEKSVHIFCDASEKAIAAVSFVRARNNAGQFELGFLHGQSKVAPVHGHTIPRLELCSAVLATEIADTIAQQLQLPLKEFKFYTDSKVVLGYINNESRRFYNYVANRVQKIRSITLPNQWQYVSTNNNPADKGTRGVHASEMSNSVWITGPQFLLKDKTDDSEKFTLQNPDTDKELRPDVLSLKTGIEYPQRLGTSRFGRFSLWKTLIKAIAHLKHVAHSFASKSSCTKWHICSESASVNAIDEARKLVLQEAQVDTFSDEIDCLITRKPLAKSSSIASLTPFLDKENMLRIGGRIQNSNVPDIEKHPILLSGRHHIALLIVRHYHELSHHQGRHITEGSIRSAGF